MHVPYKGVMHILVGHKNGNNKWVPHTTPCASILFGPEHPKTQEFYSGLRKLVKLCRDNYDGIDIVNRSNRLELITMTDMEKALREGIKCVWRNARMKICAYHYAKGLFQNIGESKIRPFYCGKKRTAKVYYYFRNFFGMLAAPPHLVQPCWNLVYKKKMDTEFGFWDVCPEQGEKWLRYHKKTYMDSKEYIKSWNHYRSYVRTNNELENRNGKVNKMFGSHPYIGRWSFLLAKWYQLEYVELQEYLKQGYQRKRTKKEIMKNELLDKCWDFIDEKRGNETDKDLLIFMKYASVALSGKERVIKGILKRRCFYVKE